MPDPYVPVSAARETVREHVAQRGGNTYATCPGTGQRVSVVTAPSDRIGTGRIGSNGMGTCRFCGRVVSQRGGVASRHADKSGKADA